MGARVLDHAQLEVYQVARELSREICRVRKKVRPGRSDLVDQLLRSVGSVPLNIAEGNGETRPGRRAYFFRIARSSATEVASVLDHMIDMQLLKSDDIIVAKGLIVRIVSMLVRLTEKISTPDSYPLLPTRKRPRNR